LEKAREFDPLGHNKIDPLKVLAAGDQFYFTSVVVSGLFSLESAHAFACKLD
jgi:hypothetical protein